MGRARRRRGMDKRFAENAKRLEDLRNRYNAANPNTPAMQPAPVDSKDRPIRYLSRNGWKVR